MSFNIKIKDDCRNTLYLHIQESSVEFEAWRGDAAEPELITIWFDLRCKEDREALQKLVSHLHHQLEVHRVPTDDEDV